MGFMSAWDERLNVCVHCGGAPETRDHVPSRVFLDDPLPPNLHVVHACRACNESFSLDEEYTACLIECVVSGTADARHVTRERVRRILEKKKTLADRLGRSARRTEAGGLEWSVEQDRVRNVLLKLARSHAQFALAEPQLEEPVQMAFVPFPLLSDPDREHFEEAPPTTLYPEVGSRAMQEAFGVAGGGRLGVNEWRELQRGRYRFMVIFDGGVTVRIVIGEYLAAEIVWE